MILYRVLTDFRDIVRNGTANSVGEVCLVEQNMWTRENYTKEDYVIGFIKRK